MLRWQPLCQSVRAVAKATAVVLVLAGCASREAYEINKAAVASRISYTDDATRLFAHTSASLFQKQAADYRVGPEDLLVINVFEWEIRNQPSTVEARVMEGGTISLPILGEVPVGGLTVEQVRQLLETRLKEDGILLYPRVSVAIKEYRSKRVAVVGAVQEPGVYTLRQNVTMLLDILTLAGGVSDRAGQVLYVLRPRPRPAEGEEPNGDSVEPKIVAIDLYDLMERGELGLNVVLHHGDVVNVPEAPKFYVVGFVNKAGGFPLNRPTTVLEGIALAGGLREREASPRRSVLKRRTPDGEEIIPLDLVAISRGESPNLFLKANDVIEVRQTGAKRVFLEGFDAFKAIVNIGYIPFR